jgi:glycosyltransferase involved in cell wall biosynthesis
MNRLRIAHFVGSVDPDAGGPSRVVLSLIREQLKLGHEVLLCCQTNYSQQKGSTELISEICASCKPELLWFSTPALLSTSLMRHQAMQRAMSGTQAVHIHGMWQLIGYAAARHAASRGISYVLTPHGMLEPWSLRHRGWKKRLALCLAWHKVIRSAGVVHVTGDKEAFGMSELPYHTPVAKVPVGVDIDPPTIAGPAFIEFRWPETTGRNIAVFLGRLHPVKGLDSLIRSWACVLEKHNDWHLLIVGPDEAGYRATLERLAISQGVSQSLTFTGPIWRQDKAKLLHEADLLVAPSLQENFGLSIAEGMAASLPVITTNQTPWRQLIDHNCGWWIDVGEAPLTAALDSAMAMDEAERSAIGRRGYELIKREYAWPEVTEQIIQLYRWLATGTPRPSYVRQADEIMTERVH